jgi:nucleoside phosphorylase
LKSFEATCGPDHPALASPLTNLGRVAQDQGDLTEARQCQERALRISEAAYSLDHPTVATALTNLAIVARVQGDLAEARRCLERALRIEEVACGSDHPQVAIILTNLGLVAQDQGGVAEAQRCQERALRISEAAYGPDHPHVAIVLSNLGYMLAEDDPERATSLIKRALSIFRQFLGDKHPHTNQAFRRLQKIEDQTRRVTMPSPGTKDQSMGQVDRKATMSTVGIITALAHEFDAVRAMLSDFQRQRVEGYGSGREYGIGVIASPRGGVHRVVLARTITMGNNSAALRAEKLLADFPTVDSIIMCGIAGGVPSPNSPDDHVRLGDIVVSDRRGVVQYDFGKQTSGAFEDRHSPRPPSAMLLEAVNLLEEERVAGHRPWEVHLQAGLKARSLARPADSTDVLRGKGGRKVAHPIEKGPRPRVFLGPIASSNSVQGDAARRDALRDQFRVKAVEMEGSGIADAAWEHDKVGYLVVRGICDYCDFKNKRKQTDLWKPYAAMAAAAYVRALLESMPGIAVANP